MDDLKNVGQMLPDLADVDVVRQLIALAAELGVDTSGILDRLGIDAVDLDRPDGFLDSLQWFAAEEAIADALGDPLFGLRLAEHFAVRRYGLLGMMFELCATPRDAVHMLARNLSLFLPKVKVKVYEFEDTCRVRYYTDYDPRLTGIHRQEVIGGLRLNPGRALGRPIDPKAVRLRQSGLPAERLEAFFGVPVEQGAVYDEVDYALADMCLPSPRSDVELLRHLEDAVATQLARRQAWIGKRTLTLKLDGCQVDLVNGRVERPDGTVWLTSRERDLLEYLAARPNQVISHQVIERDIWKLVPSVVSHAPAVAIRRLRQKIEPKGSPHPVNLLTVFGEGWKLVVRGASPARK